MANADVGIWAARPVIAELPESALSTGECGEKTWIENGIQVFGAEVCERAINPRGCDRHHDMRGQQEHLYGIDP
jgi:hypothetical protein